MTGIQWDLSDLSRLVAQLGDVADGAQANMRAAVEINARKVKDSWNGKLYREGHAKRTGRAIDYDVTVTNDAIEAEVGARRGSGRQAGVVRLLENGSIHNGPHGYGASALEENRADLEQGIQRAIDDALSGAGL